MKTLPLSLALLAMILSFSAKADPIYKGNCAQEAATTVANFYSYFMVSVVSSEVTFNTSVYQVVTDAVVPESGETVHHTTLVSVNPSTCEVKGYL